MEKRLMDVGEIIDETSLSKINLVANVRSGVLTAYDYHTLSPVDWEALERQFNEIKEMIRQQIPGTRQENVPYTNPHTGKPSTTIKNVPCLIDPVKIQYDDWTDGKGAIYPTQPLPPATLHDCLIRKTRPTIPLSQYNEFLNEWGSRQYEPVILESVFLESDVLKFSDSNPRVGNTKKVSSINTTEPEQKEDIGVSERKTWLKVIVLLTYSLGVELHGKEDDIFTKKGKKKINPEAVAEFLQYEAKEMFHGQKKPEDRLGSTTIRDILDEAETRLTPDIFKYIKQRIPA